MPDLAVYNFNVDTCTYENNLIFSDSDLMSEIIFELHNTN